jgi:hypothetical protein
MAPAPDTTATFSHDVAVAAITRYYQFIERLYGPGIIKYPPEGGWPQVKPHLAQHMNLDLVAFRLIKELPYCEPHIVPECRPNNYPAGFATLDATIERTGSPPRPVYENNPELDPEFPPHIFSLAQGGYRMGSTLAIDTKRGVAIWHNMNEDSLAKGCPEPDAASEIDYDSDLEAHEPLYTSRGWRSAPTYRIETFFAMAEEQLKLLHWIPILSGGDEPIAEPRVYGEPNEEQQERIKILRDAGWPGDNWDHIRAYRATEAWKEARDKLEMVEESMKKLEANL